MTVRAGEPVHDNVAGQVRVTDVEMIRIRGAGAGWACVFYDEAAGGCGIYADRPRQCRLLKCWDDHDIRQDYDRNRLSRADLFSTHEGLWGLIREHESACPHGDALAAALKIREILKIRDRRRPGAPGGVSDKEDEASASDALSRLRKYVYLDNEIRRRCAESGRVPTGWADLAFGRPLVITLKPLGLDIREEGDRFVLRPLAGGGFSGGTPC